MNEPASAPDVVLYDDQCPMCSAQMRFLKRRDGRGKFRFVGRTELEAAEIAKSAPEVTPEALQTAMHVVAGDGRVFAGPRAVRRIAGQLPLLWPLWLLLWIPGALWVAGILYRFVARRRLVISKLFGCTHACSIDHKHSA